MSVSINYSVAESASSAEGRGRGQCCDLCPARLRQIEDNPPRCWGSTHCKICETQTRKRGPVARAPKIKFPQLERELDRKTQSAPPLPQRRLPIDRAQRLVPCPTRRAIARGRCG